MSAAILSGVLSALSASFAKLSLTPAAESPFKSNFIVSIIDSSCNAFLQTVIGQANIALYVPNLCSHAYRGFGFMCMLIVNIIVISCFVSGIKEKGSLSGTAITTSANFIASAVFGIIFFGEIVTMTWLLGFAFILVGMVMLSAAELKPSIATSIMTKEKVTKLS